MGRRQKLLLPVPRSPNLHHPLKVLQALTPLLALPVLPHELHKVVVVAELAPNQILPRGQIPKQDLPKNLQLLVHNLCPD